MENGVVKAVIRATSEIVVVCGAGVWLGHKGIIGRAELKKISLMIEQLLTPALIFSNFIVNLDTLDILSWLPVFICSGLIAIC